MLRLCTMADGNGAAILRRSARRRDHRGLAHGNIDSADGAALGLAPLWNLVGRHAGRAAHHRPQGVGRPAAAVRPQHRARHAGLSCRRASQARLIYLRQRMATAAIPWPWVRPGYRLPPLLCLPPLIRPRALKKSKSPSVPRSASTYPEHTGKPGTKALMLYFKTSMTGDEESLIGGYGGRTRHSRTSPLWTRSLTSISSKPTGNLAFIPRKACLTPFSPGPTANRSRWRNS